MGSPTICFYCQKRPATGRDHVIPRIVGGPDGGWNRVPACTECDHSKGSKSFEKFTGRTGLPQSHVDRGYPTTDAWARAHGWVDFNTWRMAELRSRNDARFRNRKHNSKQERERVKKAYRRARLDALVSGHREQAVGCCQQLDDCACGHQFSNDGICPS